MGAFQCVEKSSGNFTSNFKLYIKFLKGKRSSHSLSKKQFELEESQINR